MKRPQERNLRLILCVAALNSSAYASMLFQTPPAGLRVTTFASGLNFPASMTTLPDGSLLVGTTAPAPQPGFAAYYFGSGQLVRFTDAANTGIADNAGAVVVSGLPGAVSTVRSVGGLIAVATVGNGTQAGLLQEDITFFRPGPNPASAYANLGGIHFSVPDRNGAVNITLDSRPTPGAPGSYDIFFSLGAGQNDGTAGSPYTLTGLASATLPAGSLYRATVDTTAATPSISNITRIADGIRNSGGILANQASGDAYFSDNGYENNAGVPVSADELGLLTAAQIDSCAVTSFGYPGSYTAYDSGAFVGGLGVPPIAAFRPLNGAESFGINELAFAPAGFPMEWNDGIFAGFDGNFNHSGLLNNTNPMMFYDFKTGKYSPFIQGGQAGVGHLIGLASTDNALFLADLSSADGWIGGSGVIYEVATATPEPSSAALLAIGLAVLLWVRRRGFW